MAPFIGAALAAFAMIMYYQFGFKAWLACMAAYTIPAGFILYFILTH